MDFTLITSTTNSVGGNRASHAAKVALSATLTMFFLSRFPPAPSTTRNFLLLGACAFPIPLLATTLFPSAGEAVAIVWGAPNRTRARLQVPLATGAAIALLGSYLRSLPLSWSTVAKGSVGLLLTGVVLRSLWTLLSQAVIINTRN